MHARARRLLAVLAVPLLALGCSDDGPDIDERADRRLAREVTLTVDDLPDGFEEQEEDDDEPESGDVIDECGEEVGIDEDDVDENRVAEAGDDVSFQAESDTEFTRVQSSVTTFRDAGLARRQLEAFDDDDFFDCLSEGFEDEMADDEAIADFSIEVITPAVDGDAAAAVAMEIESGGFPFEMQVHMVVIDRVGIVLQVLAAPDGVDDDLVDDAFDAMLDRLEDAQG